MLLFCLSLYLLLLPANSAAHQETETYTILPGDTWAALSYRYNVPATDWPAYQTQMNQQSQPIIGSTMILPATPEMHMGQLIRPSHNLLQTAVSHNRSPWTLALQNNLPHPYQPLLNRPLLLAGGNQPPRDLPPGLTHLELSTIPATPGQALAFRAHTSRPLTLTASLAGTPFATFSNGNFHLGLMGTGAFYGDGIPLLTLTVANQPSQWTQPWLFTDDNQWDYQQITLTGQAAAIDQAAIEAERARLFELWNIKTPEPQWQTPFQLPISNYLDISSSYGARRSYNGGPYRTYHEGVDFSAYGGTAVTAPATGTVILAEFLYVRGGAVIIDHGLGIYTGYYHMSAITVEPGQIVAPGQLLGEVGTTGLSTGNHLHWDLLVNGTWVDALTWVEEGLDCWLLAGLGRMC